MLMTLVSVVCSHEFCHSQHIFHIALSLNQLTAHLKLNELE